MPRQTSKTLSFPIAGVARRASYRKQVRPYVSPAAVNVRGNGSLEERQRGGSRPGLVAISGIEKMESEILQWPDGSAVEWPDGSDVIFDISVPVISADGGLILTDRSFLIRPVVESGKLPDDHDISCVYRNRLIVVKDNLWYASRAGDYSDWDFGANFEDVSRAAFGAAALAGYIGEDITAIVPYRDSHLIISTKNSLWVLQGDPATGQMSLLSEEVGVIAPMAWAFAGSMLVFLTNDGVYIGGVESRPVRMSEEVLPGALRNVNVNTNTILMAFDISLRGVHLFITPDQVSGEYPVGTNYWIDIDTSAIWPVSFSNSDDHQPVSIAYIYGPGTRDVALLGRDDVWRKFDIDADDDDGDPINSSVIIGPFLIATDEVRDCLVSEVDGILATGYFDCHGVWGESRNRVVRPRSRGAWAAFKLSSVDKWAYEAIVIRVNQLGRIRI